MSSRPRRPCEGSGGIHRARTQRWLPALVLIVALTAVLTAVVRRADAGVTVVVPGCAIPPADVIAWWRGDSDLSAEIGPDLVGAVSFEPALIGDGVRLNGTNTAHAADFPMVSAGVSVDLWIRPVRSEQAQALMTRWDFPAAVDDGGAFALLLIGDDLVWTTDETSTLRPEELRVTTTGLFDGDYHHLAATWSPTEMALYVDGLPIGSKPSQGGVLNPATSTPFRIGSKQGIGDPLYFAGVIDEPAVYRRALTAIEVDDLVAAGPNGKCTAVDGLVGPGLQVSADRGGVDPVVSPDGRYVLFRTRSTDVFPVVTDPLAQTPGSDLDLFDDARDDLVLLDTKNTNVTTDDTVELVSVDSDELGGRLDSSGGVLTPNATHIAFSSISDDLVSGDTIAGRDLFVRNRLTGTTQKVSVRSDGSQPQYTATGTNNDNRDPSINDAGTVIAFASTNRDLAPEANPVPGDTWQTYDIYVRDVSAGDPLNWVTERVTAGIGAAKADGSSSTPIVSPDGRYVWFSSAATNLVAGDTNGHVDLFVHDRQTDITTRLEVTGATGQPLDGDALIADVTPNGRYVLFSSDASTIVPDTNAQFDAFLLDTQTATVYRMSPAGNGPTFARAVSANGRYAIVQSSASNLVVGDTNGRADTFIADRSAGSITRISVDAGAGQRDGDSTGATATSTLATFVYMFQRPGDGMITIWRSGLQLV